MEKLAFCFSQASRQAHDIEEFMRLRHEAAEAYESAATFYEKEDPAKGKSVHCHALAKYVSSWLAPTPWERRKILEECCVLGRKGLELYEKAGDELNFGKMCNDILWCLLERLYVASDWQDMRSITQEGFECANRALSILSKLDDKSELLRAYFTACLQSWYVANFGEQEEKTQKELVQKSLSYSAKALELSEEVNDPYLDAMSSWAAAFCALVFTEKAESALEYARKMLERGTIVKDNYLKGIAYYLLAFIADWMTLREADPDKEKEGHSKIIQYSEEAIRCLELVSQDYFLAETYLFYAESYSSLASNVEIGTEERRSILKKAVEIGCKGLEHANRSGSPEAAFSMLHALSKAMHSYANVAIGQEEKKNLLKEALEKRVEFAKVVERVFPSNDWIRGVGKNYEGLVEADLAKAEEDQNRKRALLENAVKNVEDGVSHCKRWIVGRPVPAQIVAVAMYEDSLGGILNELYLLAGDKKIVDKAIEVYGNAAERFKKASLPSRAAETYWRIARSQDRLGAHLKAAESFDKVFEEYRTAAQKTPDFADFYLDHATYMKAWSEIERASLAHEHEKYAEAMMGYEKVAGLLRQTKSWSYLSSNFLAWSLLEQAEHLSRKESGDESIGAFDKAAEFFRQAEEAFEQETDKIQNPDEKDKAIELSQASAQRRDYCLVRANVEEAIVHDRKGNHAESAEKFGLAASGFERILETMKRESDRREIESLAYICRAWEKMKQADRSVSPELYREASRLFLQAKEHSARDRTCLLASGNSAFCEALEHGTKFEATREKDDFSKVKQHLSSAANYYLRAGLDNASAWTSATEVLFDAYNYMMNAETEGDPDKKMKAYLLAEKCLERSAKLFETAGYVGKRDEVLKTLKKVEEKREFALSLGELLSVPGEASSTRAMSAPGLSVEEPVGLSKFERAFVQANLNARQQEVLVGGSFRLEIQLVNLGRSTAFLMSVDEIIPEGFAVAEKPEKCIVNDGGLSLKGKKLAPLETSEMKLALKPRKKGRFVFTPKIQFMDEAGEHKSFELEQVTVTVKELGIRGWLRGAG